MFVHRCSLLKQVAIFKTGNITPLNIFASTSSVITKNNVILMLHSRPLAKLNHDLIYAFGDWLQATVNRLTANNTITLYLLRRYKNCFPTTEYFFLKPLMCLEIKFKIFLLTTGIFKGHFLCICLANFCPTLGVFTHLKSFYYRKSSEMGSSSSGSQRSGR